MSEDEIAQFTCDCSQNSDPFTHYWEHTVGSGHATLALRADWQEQLKKCHDDLGFRHVRFHGLLSDDMGTLTCQQNELLYSFFNADQIFDFLLSIGMRPFVELSFMPYTLSSGGDIVFSYKANVTPPKDFKKWYNLINKLVRHWIDRYGRSEVRQWYFEVWNEPNLDNFWKGSQEDYFKLYRSTVKAVKNADEMLRVGGPVTAKNEWIPEFLDYCEDHDLPADFVSTHHYPTDAFGEPGDDTETQLSKAPRSVLRDEAQKANNEAGQKPLFYTEWNSSSNPRDHLHDEPYSAAFITKTIMEAIGLVDCYSFWTFTDIFEENYFPSVPFQGGFGLLNLQGIAKPTYRAYQLLHQLGTEKLSCSGTHDTVDMWVVRKKTGLTVLLTNHALPKHPVQTEQVEIKLSNISSPKTARISRVDEDHCNAKQAWQQMGEPEYLSHTQVETLKAASKLNQQILPFEYREQSVHLNIELPPHGIAAIEIDT